MPVRTKDLEVRFNLKSIKDKNKPSLIRAVFRYGNPTRRLVYSTQRKIQPNKWNSRKQLPRIDYVQYSDLKKDLNTLASLIIKINRDSKGMFSPKEFREILDKQLKRVESKDAESLMGFWESYVERVRNASDMSNRTAQKFHSSGVHIKAYFESIEQIPTFEGITWYWHEGFKQYLYDTHQHSVNNVAKIIANLQLVMRDAFKKKIHSNTIMNEKGFRIKTMKTKNKIRLTEDELSLIALYPYPSNRLQRVADMAIVGCYTGFRYSDWSSITKDKTYIIDAEGEEIECLKIMNYKTKEELPIPILPELKTILDKYDYNLPKFTLKEFNEQFKKVCELAIPESTYLRIYNKAGVTKNEQSYKYQFASSHACRRSFASNFYEIGFSPNLLRHITGHASEGQFLAYVDVNVNDMAIEFAKEVMRKRREAKVLSISKGA